MLHGLGPDKGCQTQKGCQVRPRFFCAKRSSSLVNNWFLKGFRRLKGSGFLRQKLGTLRAQVASSKNFPSILARRTDVGSRLGAKIARQLPQERKLPHSSQLKTRFSKLTNCQTQERPVWIMFHDGPLRLQLPVYGGVNRLSVSYVAR